MICGYVTYGSKNLWQRIKAIANCRFPAICGRLKGTAHQRRKFQGDAPTYRCIQWPTGRHRKEDEGVLDHRVSNEVGYL